MKNMKVKQSVGSRIFDAANLLILAGVSLICLVPFMFVI